MVRVGRLRHRVLTILAVIVTFAAAAVAAVAAAPAANAGSSPYEVSDGELKVVCDAFKGSYSDTRDGYACSLPNSAIDCLAATQSCKYQAEKEMPGPFADNCATVPGAKFSVIGKSTFLCENRDLSVITDCPADPELPDDECDMGVTLSEPPVR
jgi:hypothetical protein